MNSDKKNLEIISDNGSTLDISPAYDHLNAVKPKSSEESKPKNIVIPKSKKKSKKEN